MNHLLAIPMEVRLAALFVVGICLASLVNLGTYRLAWHPRAMSPWSRAEAGAPRRRWSDRLPVVGWLGLRREVSLHGTGFWIRPMLVELLAGLGLAALYWWEIDRLGLLAADFRTVIRPAWITTLHQPFAAHVVLMGFMAFPWDPRAPVFCSQSIGMPRAQLSGILWGNEGPCAPAV